MDKQKIIALLLKEQSNILIEKPTIKKNNIFFCYGGIITLSILMSMVYHNVIEQGHIFMPAASAIKLSIIPDFDLKYLKNRSRNFHRFKRGS